LRHAGVASADVLAGGHKTVADWASAFAGRAVVVVCQEGHGLSEGALAGPQLVCR
jgi:hypothetical protein